MAWISYDTGTGAKPMGSTLNVALKGNVAVITLTLTGTQ